MTKQTRAFTLAELLVALAITSVLATLLVSIVSATMNVWRQSRNQIDTFSGARQLLVRITDELRGAMAASGQVEFSENLTATSFTTGGTSPTAGTAENVFFVAPYPNSAAGDLCAIGYRLNGTTHELQRAFVKSDDTWNGAPKYRSGGYSFQWQSILRNVLEFELQCYSQADLDNGTEPPATTWNSETGQSYMLGNVPRRVRIRIKLVDEKSLARLNAIPTNSSGYNRILLQSAREFRGEVSLLPPH